MFVLIKELVWKLNHFLHIYFQQKFLWVGISKLNLEETIYPVSLSLLPYDSFYYVNHWSKTNNVCINVHTHRKKTDQLNKERKMKNCMFLLTKSPEPISELDLVTNKGEESLGWWWRWGCRGGYTSPPCK